MPQMQGGAAGGLEVLPPLRNPAGPGAPQGPEACQRDRHGIQAPGAQEEALGGREEQNHHRIL